MFLVSMPNSDLTKERIFRKPYFNRKYIFIAKILITRAKYAILAYFTLFLFYFIILQVLEGWTPIDTTWFLIATIATVGYGDIYPKYEISRILTIALIMISIISIAVASTLIFETISRVSKPKFLNEHQLKEVRSHVIIVGINPLAITISELFIEIGIKPILVSEYSLSDELAGKFLHVVGDIRSAETFVKANIEWSCLK